MTLMKRLTIGSLTVLCALLLGGCIDLEGNIVWLPDSSGFLFTRDGAVVLYDVNRRAERTVVSCDWIKAGKGRVAVSPDSKQVALIRMHTKKESIEHQVQVFDMNGRLIAESRTLRLHCRPADEPRDEKVECGAAEWSPRGDHIVFWAMADDEPCLGIYDVEMNSIKAMPQLMPYPSCLFGANCCVPDGDGVLAVRKVRKDEDEGEERDTTKRELVYVAWDGWVYDIEDGDLLGVLPLLGSEIDSILYPRARWSENKLILMGSASGRRVEWQVDISNRKACRETKQDELLEYAQNHNVRGLARFGDGIVLQGNGKAIQVAKPSKGASKTLVADASGSGVWFIISPDERCAVIRYTKDKIDRLLVVDARGNVIATRER